MGRKKQATNGKPAAEPKKTLKALRIRHNVPAELPTSFANNLLVQHEASTFTLLFFDVRLPLLIDDGSEETKEQIKNITHADASCIARIVVPAHMMPAIIKALNDNMQTHQERMAELLKTVELDGQSHTK